MPYKILLEKENFKFSCSHFTIFSEGSAERLHGHNYYLSIELRAESVDPKSGLLFDFNEVKPLVRSITESLDEFVLLPERSDHLKLSLAGERTRASFGAKEYEFPSADVRILPLVNITSEELARYVAMEFLRALDVKRLGALSGVSVGVEETRGQKVIYEIEAAEFGK